MVNIEKQDERVHRVATAYALLINESNELSAQSDVLIAVVSEVEACINKLRLGIEAWVTYSESVEKWKRQIGFGRLEKRGAWGFKLRYLDMVASGNTQVWDFNNASRRDRIYATALIPDVFEALVKQAVELNTQLRGRISMMEAISCTLSGLEK